MLTLGYAQMDPEGDELASHLHITPCRASRALALRFLALKCEQTMADMTVVSLPARISRQGEDKVRVTGHTSDLSELISGLCKVRAPPTCPAMPLPVTQLQGAGSSPGCARCALAPPALPFPCK